MRRLIAFPCAGDTLIGSLDEGAATTGLLIVSGGNEIRMGAHRGMASLAARLASAGTPVFRYDRRGIGDSTGENRGFLESAPDIAAAAATFAAETGIRRIVAFGNCDAATALALFHGVAGIDALILANPWVIEDKDDLPPAAAIRARYAERLRDPKQWLRLMRGGVNIVKLTKGLSKIASKSSQSADDLGTRLVASLGASATPTTLLLAKADNTAIAFRKEWDAAADAPARVRLEQCDTDSHSFATAADKEWLFEQVQAAIVRAR
ncbi:MAG: hydrolase 1, exosortase system-associated [Sphingomonas bacterium]|uniref:hydrolase 1, exosortase A system-associated n=1 Tax=Sphingomonas bacterium TaxID=1895847 RepID=UPI00260AF11A|nr:hydrolase 1, exosortase A system-associated [Sphingomonas bacterium]MDB5703153.1 hydrolase 1, exosortase system-associated [Sphingomonas bacterium]